jgi:isocitrate dehydrogenase (NAD+)
MGDKAAVFEAVHGTAPDIAGRNVANPMALLMSAIMMLRHMGEGDRADAVMQAMLAVLRDGRVRTRDLGGASTTTEFADAICHHIEFKGPAPA